mgnify:CR=1 FL=1
MKSIEFFDKSLGTWKSFRTYMYPLSNKIETLETEFTWENIQPFVYTVKWGSEKGQGSLNLKLVEDKLIERNAGYFTDKPTISNIIEVNPTYLQTETTYNNTIYLETIEFFSANHRARRTVGYKQLEDGARGQVILSGSYQERKIREGFFI